VAIYNVSKRFGWGGRISDKVSGVLRMFGLTAEKLSQQAICYQVRLEIEPGDVVYITGPSGSGKSVLLKQLQQCVAADEQTRLDAISLATDKSVIDCIDADLLTSLRTLSSAGLNDVFCVLNSPANLSEGQKYRFRLAMSMASGRKFVFADEFCSNLDRITAAVIAYNVRRFARKHCVTFILASSHDDLSADLQPDVLVVRQLAGETEVVYKNKKEKGKKM
jgi:ABC-type ATPase with predicted acetyltransferase domain